MKNSFLLLTAALMIAAGASAQKGVDSGTQYGVGDDSVRCITNISLFVPYAKSNNFKDAYPFWKIVYDECPASTKNIYIYGIDILKWMLAQESDAAKKEEIIAQLLKLYDDRAKYFGDDKRYGKDWIVSRKAQDYNQLKGDATDPALIYKWTGEVIDEFKEKTEPQAISLYMFASLKMMQGNDEHKGQYINDFLKCTALLDAAIAAAQAANNEKDVENITNRKVEIEKFFVSSGAAECETLQNLYATKIEANKDNLEFLKETISLLRRVGCKEIDAYFTAAEYAHKIEPTAESAMGLGSKALKDKDMVAADKYFNEAINMTEDSGIKADMYYALAAMASQQDQLVKAKQYSLKCLAEKPDYGRAYLIIATAYASGAKGIFPEDPVKTKCVFYAVVDKLEKARQADPSIADDANRLIATYRQYYPSKEEVFMHPDLNMGDNFTIGGWIGETVKLR